ncbi:ATP-binding protein [Paenibacillus allorhizosphaerae]|uniref:Sensor histidine kinase RcsC n=1 Tax=Paenibacillus allorhizosphaerae TaxID=2849866 RepID=A0ABM8VML6_9BACL|nr:ATP-binding protein [Paenibacillus allorhizosphaerae]CAG7650170.1 Sensor histidine kinase RcsC [Paenibacillus allorhizosphaerae]
MSIFKTVQLSHKVNVENGARILYSYDSVEGYLRNAMSFIQSAVDFGQHVIFIDSMERFESIAARLKSDRPRNDFTYVHFVDNGDFFRRHDDFQFEKVLTDVKRIIEPSKWKEELSVRIWGHADWTLEQVKAAPNAAKRVIVTDEFGYFTVCCYDGNAIPASAQNEKLKTHEYLMTDQNMIHSNMYRSHRNKQLLPSHSAQYEIETEMDFYKQKLDFVHAVSHEVRNPLTVIKAYSMLLMQKAEDEADREKLKAICDYVMLIDNEISHIINTEQLLTTESLWLRKQVVPKALLAEVTEMMEVKARTQGMKLVSEISLSDGDQLLSNAIGFKLIVSNILSNAVKYSYEGGSVFLHVYTDNLRLHIVVRDYGVGIGKEQLGLLFRKYEKFNEEKGGQGIGLFMVKKLVDYFDGEIEIKSSPNEGTVVTVILPLQPEPVLNDAVAE